MLLGKFIFRYTNIFHPNQLIGSIILFRRIISQHIPKESETGVTIHRVNAEYDSGKIVAQTTVPVLERDTLETLAARVLEREHEFLVEVIADIVNGKIPLGE